MNILFPLFGMAAITFITMFRLAYLRTGAVARRELDPRYYRVYQGDGEPEKIAANTRHLSNLFESPVLFYVAVIVAFVTDVSSSALVALAWIYVVIRAVHSWIHLGSNIVIWRFRVFGMSVTVLLIMWIMLGVRLFTL